MIERIASITADALAMRQTSVVHQYCAALRMSGENRKHGALIVMPEMKEGIPSQDATKLPSKRYRPHV